MTTPPRLTVPALGATHGFFTRQGGVSAGGYASLNGSLSGGDDPSAVAENRRRVAAALGLAPTCLMGLAQVHSALVVTVTKPWLTGRGSQADAMVTNRPEIGLVVITADCAPVLLADEPAGVIGAAHAGWRGALEGVLEATVEAMRTLGATAIAAAIGPCIAARSYQVGAEIRGAVLEHRPQDAPLFTPDAPDHWRFDLPGYCAARLLAAGVHAQALNADTYADAERFFSHRRRTHGGGGVIGHQMSAIRL